MWIDILGDLGGKGFGVIFGLVLGAIGTWLYGIYAISDEVAFGVF